MLASILIIAISTALLIYWFRYTCLLILATRTGKDYASAVAAANRLAFAGIEGPELDLASADALSSIELSLERDYRLLTYLLKQVSGASVGGLTVEQRMLMLDFWLMRLQFKLTRRVAITRARRAVSEMTGVLNRLANDMGHRVEASSLS